KVSTMLAFGYNKLNTVSGWAFGCLLLFVAFALPRDALHAQGAGAAQQPEIVIRGGHVIDPRNQIDGIMDVSIVAGRIAQVASGITPSAGASVIDASGLYVTP